MFNNLLEQDIIQDTIDADKEKKSTGRKKRLRKIIGLDTAEDNRNRMIKIVDDRKAAANKKKKESDASEGVAKKGRNKVVKTN